MFAQIIAICIFVTMFLLIILDKFERHYITLGSGALVLVLVFGVCMRSMSAIWETLNLGAFFQSTFWYGASEESTAGINWSTILFIAGMMIMVEGLGKSGFFRWLCLSLAKATHYHVVPLLVCFMAMAAFLAMFMIGLAFELKLERDQVRDVVRALIIRFGSAAVFALGIYYLTPWSRTVRQTLALIVFAPVSAMTVINTQRCGGDTEKAGVISSLSILTSIVVITLLVIRWNLS